MDFYKHVYSLGKNLDFLGGDHETRSGICTYCLERFIAVF